MNNEKLEMLIKYLKVLSAAYFDGDPLDVKDSAKRTIHLIELEFCDTFKEEEN